MDLALLIILLIIVNQNCEWLAKSAAVEPTNIVNQKLRIVNHSNQMNGLLTNQQTLSTKFTLSQRALRIVNQNWSIKLLIDIINHMLTNQLLINQTVEPTLLPAHPLRSPLDFAMISEASHSAIFNGFNWWDLVRTSDNLVVISHGWWVVHEWSMSGSWVVDEWFMSGSSWLIMIGTGYDFW